MDLNTLISQYGYAALVIGSLAEGETGKVMPVPAAALSYKKQKAAQMAAAGQTAQND